MTKTIGTGDVTDFDETRRLLYMALVADRTKKYNLAGTIINALVHHHAVEGLSAGEVADHVVNVLEGANAETASDSRAWMQSQIDRITAELDG
jgi:hypothetical protein